MKTNFNNCSSIKGLRFFTKENCPYYCRFFLHTQKDPGGASIHRIDKSFPLKPSLVKNMTNMMRTCTIKTHDFIFVKPLSFESIYLASNL